MRVLVVEDHVDLCHARRFDVVLCDLGLPDIPGEIVIRHLLATAATPPVVVGITGGGELHVSRAMAAGAQVVFRKPIEWERIVAFLRGLKGRPGDVSDVAS